MRVEHILGWWSRLGTNDLESVILNPAMLADERQRRDDEGGWCYVGETPCDCGCSEEVVIGT